jgi:flagellar hook-associated protein 2
MTVSGLASGLDTEEIIRKLMEIERAQVKRLEARKADLQADKNAWKDIGTRLNNLLGALTPLKLQSTFTGMTATSSKPEALSATATADASPGTYRIWIKQLAQAHKVASDQPKIYGAARFLVPQDAFDDPAYTDTYATLNRLEPIGNTDKVLTISGSNLSGSIETDPLDLSAPNGVRLTLTATHSRTLNATFRYEYRYYHPDTGTWSNWTSFPGSPFTYGSTGGSDTVTLAAEISDPVSQVQVRAVLERQSTMVQPLLMEWSLKAEALERVTDASTSLGLSGRFRISVGSSRFEVEVQPQHSLNDLRAAINAAASGGGSPLVRASVVDNRLVITSATSGQAGKMAFEDLEGSVLRQLGILDSAGNLSPQAEIAAAQDAVLSVEGLTISRPSNTVTDVIAGVKLDLLGVTDDGDGMREPGEELVLSVAHKPQAAVDAVKRFIEQYNSLMDFIAEKLGKTATGKPGELFGDPTLARIQQELRRLVLERVNLAGTKYTSAGAVGINTGSGRTGALAFDRAGKLGLDEAKFTKALEEDPQGVYQLFASRGPRGIAVRLEESLKSLTRASLGTHPTAGDGVISTKQKWIDLIVRDIDTQIARWEDRLARKEEQMRRQFKALETMLGELQSQANWLAGQIASLQSLWSGRQGQK